MDTSARGVDTRYCRYCRYCVEVDTAVTVDTVDVDTVDTVGADVAVAVFSSMKLTGKFPVTQVIHLANI